MVRPQWRLYDRQNVSTGLRIKPADSFSHLDLTETVMMTISGRSSGPSLSLNQYAQGSVELCLEGKQVPGSNSLICSIHGHRAGEATLFADQPRNEGLLRRG
jgi:hypothetical protein